MNPKITQIELNLSRSTIKRTLNRLQQQEIVKEGYPNFLEGSNLGGNLGDNKEK